jgi:hypothetical protein
MRHALRKVSARILLGHTQPEMHVQRRLPLAPSRNRVWQDTAAEGLLGSAVGVIALTGINPLVVVTNHWLGSVAPHIDPVVTMLGLVVVLTSGLVLAGIALKTQAHRVAVQTARFARTEKRATSSAGAKA